MITPFFLSLLAFLLLMVVSSNTDDSHVSFWRTQALDELQRKLEIRPIEGVAKNIILFLGDGMSIPTLTAARIYLGQKYNEPGENCSLSFEKFPYTGLSKTYCVDMQVADSACSATAYLGGVKANFGTLGVTAAVPRGNCTMSSDKSHYVDTILDWAQAAGKATGIVTNTRITDASPAGHYAHIAERAWESDCTYTGLGAYEIDPFTCQDIASQLVHNAPGKNVNVLMGGGIAKFIPQGILNPYWGYGDRLDGENLILDWLEDKIFRGNAELVSTREELLDVDYQKTDYLLGLFSPQHMSYYLNEGSEHQPTLSEMTETAIRILLKEEKGFYLFVEGGMIDKAHHGNDAHRALEETLEFHKAVQTAINMVDEQDTLIVVTADHAHTMTMSGYPGIGDDILGGNLYSDVDFSPYSTLSYANGPSAQIESKTLRISFLYNYYLNEPNYIFPSLVPLLSETHGGDDVAVFARGPWAHLLVGSYEQNIIPHVMAYAARIGPGELCSLS